MLRKMFKFLICTTEWPVVRSWRQGILKDSERSLQDTEEWLARQSRRLAWKWG